MLVCHTFSCVNFVIACKVSAVVLFDVQYLCFNTVTVIVQFVVVVACIGWPILIRLVLLVPTGGRMHETA